MYKIKEAIKVAERLNRKVKSFHKGSINRWSKNEVISRIQDYDVNENTGGRSGLYPDTLPIEIAVTASLKNNNRIEQIKAARKMVLPLWERHDDFSKVYEELREIEDKFKKLLFEQGDFYMEDGEDKDVFWNMDVAGLAINYAHLFKLYHEKLETLKEV